ncbi:hypothetical protein ACFU8I_37130 [Streptomyces sp. NPDC057540]|uniref:hypothetical protein n=1 Tax=Streptomyces sp. NPDC057540 TaxID=3346160 RepID=UPI0036961853
MTPATIIGTCVTGSVLVIIGLTTQAVALTADMRSISPVAIGWALVTAGAILLAVMAAPLRTHIETRAETRAYLYVVQDQKRTQQLTANGGAPVLPLTRRAPQ